MNSERCLVGMEACGTAHHWAREISKLGHHVRLMPPSYVKGYVKRSKNDAADAAAICEAVTRPSMRFVPIKSADQQLLWLRSIPSTKPDIQRSRSPIHSQNHSIGWTFHTAWANSGLMHRSIQALLDHFVG